MTQPGSGPQEPLRFSTDWLPERDRLEIWREEFGRKIVRLDMEPLHASPLRYDAVFRMIGDASVSRGRISAISCTRSKSLLQDGNDDIVMLIPENTRLRIEQGRYQADLGAGDCLVRRSSEVGRTMSDAGRFTTLNLPVTDLAQRLADIDRLEFSVIPRSAAALSLLIEYSRLLPGVVQAGSAALTGLARNHLLDLAALAIGAHRDSWVTGQSSVRAARRLSARAAIQRNAGNPAYRSADLAREMGVSESYLRKLLAEKGDTFCRTLLEIRLEQARARLSDPRSGPLSISQIALDCGFNDISHFNRSFRRRYDKTPSEARSLK